MPETAKMSTRLAALPGWDALNAYARAKLACAELLRDGAPIPAWTTLREFIGKGSANDINRAKKDFRLEHAQALRKLEGFEAEGVPQSLTPHIQGLWQAAIACAQDAYAEKERAWQAEIEQALVTQQQAQLERDQAQAARQALQATVDELEQTCSALQEQVRSERAARAQAEKMMDELRADLAGQRDRLDTALAQAQDDLEKAINRLQASERRAMMEIEHARQDAAQKVADAQARWKTEQEKSTQEAVLLSRQLQEGQARLVQLQERNIALEKENQALKERTSQAEALQAHNAALHARLLSQFAQVRVPQYKKGKKKLSRRKRL